MVSELFAPGHDLMEGRDGKWFVSSRSRLDGR